MSKKTLLTCLSLYTLLVIVPQLFGVTYYDDGEVHHIFYPVDGPVMVDFQKPGVGTVVNWYSGASTGTCIRCGLAAYYDSIVNIYGGEINCILYSFQQSQVNIYGGWIGEFLDAGNDSVVNFYNGIIDGDLLAVNRAVVNMYGGTVLDDLEVWEDAKIILTGGKITEDIRVGFFDDDVSVLTIDGSNFTINGEHVGYGRYYADDFASGTITGTLANGDPLANHFQVKANASIILIPEPGTVALLALGGVVLRRRRKD